MKVESDRITPGNNQPVNLPRLPTDRTAPARGNILGVHVSAVDLPRTLELVNVWIAQREPCYVCLTPAHVVMEGYRDPDLRACLNRAGLTVPDGMGIVWLLNLQGYHGVGRVYGADLMLGLCEQGLPLRRRHFFYGGAPGVAERLARELIGRFPGLQVCGTSSPPFRPPSESEDRDDIERIRAAGADIVWVGIGSPRQDAWMAEHAGRIGAPVLIGVGAAFDFLSGRKPQAPRWVQRAGLEWLFRLASEPRRLWRRYAQYPLFLALVVLQSIGVTRYD
jgi:N-acetylglucosaminyldiphosphoundecaprenol N-acetyl-beta-D-mannosaminyltransferase